MGWQAKDISYTPAHVKEPTAVKTNVTITKISENSTNVRIITADRNGEVPIEKHGGKNQQQNKTVGES